MECFDRISIQTTERILRPVRLMREQQSLSGVTVRTFWSGRRFELTIRKTWPEGTRHAPVYTWELQEVEESGEPVPGGIRLESDTEPCQDPEDAYWNASERAESLG